MKVVVVSAEWDDEPRVWVAESANPEGLVTEADTLEALRVRLALIVPELLAEYGEEDTDVAIELIAHSHDLLPSRRRAPLSLGRSLPCADAHPARERL